MKKIIVLLTFNLFVYASHAQFEIYDHYTVKTKVEPKIILVARKTSNKINLDYFSLIERKLSQALIEFYYPPKKWMDIALNIRTENKPNPYRLGGNFFHNKAETYLFMPCEKTGHKNSHHRKSELPYGNLEMFAVDAIDCRFHGFGPIAKYSPRKSYLTMWFMPAYSPEHEAKRLIIGLSIKI